MRSGKKYIDKRGVMGRLTERNGDGGISVADLPAALEKLATFEDAAKQGRLVILPCKAGNTVYVIDETTPPKVAKAQAEKIRYQQIWGRGFMRTLAFVDIVYQDGSGSTEAMEFDGNGEGVGIYYSRAEAETALREREVMQ